MDGYEATQLIRTIEQEHNLGFTDKHYICGCSAEVNPRIEMKCTAAGMNNIISKPLSRSTIEELIKQCRRDTKHFQALNAYSEAPRGINMNEIDRKENAAFTHLKEIVRK